MNKRARKVGQVKGKVVESSTSEEEKESTDSSMSSDTSIFHIMEIVKEKRGRVKAIFELKDEGEHYILYLTANGRKFECLLDTGSPISIMPHSYRNLLKPKALIEEETKRNFVDVNNNPVKISTRREVKEIDFPILGMDNFRKMGLKVIQDSEDNIEDKLKHCRNEEMASRKERIACLESKVEVMKRETLTKFKKLFEENKILNNFKYKVEFKLDFKVEQQKGKRIPIHVQEAVDKELQRLIKEGHITKLEQVGKNVFVSPAVIAIKGDGSVKIAMDAVRLNKQIVKKTSQMPNLNELLDQVCIKITTNQEEEIWISLIDLEYAFGQIELDEETAKHCVIAIVGGKATGHYRFNRGFYGLADMPVIFQEKIEKTLKYTAPAWQDAVILVTRGSIEQHKRELDELLSLLEKEGYKASFKKSNMFEKKANWCGFAIDDKGISPKEDKVAAVMQISPPKTLKEVKSFVG